MKGRTANVSLVCELLAQLLWGPKTTAQLMAATGMSQNAAYGWMSHLHRAGCVYVADYKRTGCRPARVWAIQPKPFQREDAKQPWGLRTGGTG